MSVFGNWRLLNTLSSDFCLVKYEQHNNTIIFIAGVILYL